MLNVALSVVLTFVLRALKAPEGADETTRADYTADAATPAVRPGRPLAAGTEA